MFWTNWYLFDRLLCSFLVHKRDEAVAAVETGHGVHHESQVPDLAALLEQRNELVFEHLLRNFTTKHLQ